MVKVCRKIYNLHLSKDKDLARRLKEVAGITPVRLRLYKLAFLHKSMNNELVQKGNNERLEYLGDAVLSTIVADYLYQKYPTQNEGFLTKLRSRIVKRKTLNQVAERMGLDIILTDFSVGRMSSTMLGNALEALIGAVYIENGYKKTRQYVVKQIIRRYIDIHELESLDDNFKSQLLEWCQKHNKTIDYKMVDKFKFDKRDRFKIAVLIDGEPMAHAEDFNKKAAEQQASKTAIRKLGVKKPSAV